VQLAQEGIAKVADKELAAFLEEAGRLRRGDVRVLRRARGS